MALKKINTENIENYKNNLRYKKLNRYKTAKLIYYEIDRIELHLFFNRIKLIKLTKTIPQNTNIITETKNEIEFLTLKIYELQIRLKNKKHNENNFFTRY